ncbi:MAG TPA: S26 family signal peptidase [Solirubrobacteraceae bacterium]|nr:S26 family signal peptidase [Solirubrobacteraceae bacterium]
MARGARSGVALLSLLLALGGCGGTAGSGGSGGSGGSDNRTASDDSRFWGPVKRSWLIGLVRVAP